MEKRRTSFANLIFFIPITILSILMWNDYNRYVANIDDRLPSLSKIYYLDNGKKMVGLADEKLGGYSQAYLFDSATGTPLKEMKVRSNIYGTLDAAVYQHDGVIIPAYDDSFGVQLNYFRPSGEMEELAQGTLPLSSYSSLGLYTWRGRLFITGETADSELYLAEVENGKLRTSSMNSKDLFPARPVRLWKFPSNFDDDKAVPIFDVTLKDDRTAYVSGLLDKNNMPSVLLKKENESSFDAEDRAGVQFGRQFGFDSTKLVRVDSSYPGQAKFYNAAEKKWGAILPTPKPVYQAKVFLLNDREVLIAGSSAQDELNGSLLGYVYNEQTRRFIDVTELVNKLTYKDLKNTDLQFFKEIENDQLYYSFKSAAAGAFNMKTNIVQTQTSDQVKQWLVAEGEDKISLVSFWNYVKQGNALLINWVVWLAIPVLLYGGLAILMFAMKRKQSKNIAEGTIVPATIARMEETGTYINNQPLVRFTVRFMDEGQTKEVAIKKVLSFLNGVKVGDPVVISYNRRKNSAVFVTEDNIPEQDGLKMIKDAILSRIEERGQINRSRVLQLHFTADGRDYAVPALEPSGFAYRIGERANLALSHDAARIYSYGNAVSFEDNKQVTIQGEVIRIEEFPITIADRQLMMLETILTDEAERLCKSNSLFVPKGFPVKAGVVIPVVMRKDDYEKELRLQKGKQGAAVVTSVRFVGTLGERPLAQITVERAGGSYHIYQSIEPLYGVEIGDELWIAYDEVSREAIIVNYASM